MLFNSVIYIFIFLPITLIIYFSLNKFRFVLAGKSWLVLSSLFFYLWWRPEYIFIILISIILNFAIGSTLSKTSQSTSKGNLTIVLIFGITLNLGLLGYYKYMDFFITNVNSWVGFEIRLLNLVLPLAISFFTFQQIAFLVDSYQGKIKEYDFLNYCLFVSFFPQLIAGPIVHHKEMMPQFEKLRNKLISWPTISTGLFIFSIGLFKKVIIADNLSVWANIGYDQLEMLTFFESWAVSLCYTFQLYFDFSGYTDMAIGSALFFNITLPINFNSPYKALTIQDFWQRWHMTLSRWLKEYVYIPLGGSRKNIGKTYFNLIATFLFGGLWHGAGWTFIIWGAMHGFGTAFQKLWSKLGFTLPKYIAWFITFLFIHISWVFFRASDFNTALKILKGMIGFNGIILPTKLIKLFSFLGFDFNAFEGPFFKNFPDFSYYSIILLLAIILAFGFRNSIELSKTFKRDLYKFVFVVVLLSISILNLNKNSEFLYFNF